MSNAAHPFQLTAKQWVERACQTLRELEGESNNSTLGDAIDDLNNALTIMDQRADRPLYYKVVDTKLRTITWLTVHRGCVRYNSGDGLARSLSNLFGTNAFEVECKAGAAEGAENVKRVLEANLPNFYTLTHFTP